MEKIIIIPERLQGLNEYIDAERSNRFRAAKMKKETENLVMLCARKCLGGWRANGPVWMHYRWYELNRRRDKDNICGYARKAIQDALVKAGYLAGDGWAQISGFDDTFAVDASNPRVEVEIEEIDETE